VTLSPLSCWKHLPPEKQKERVVELVQEIEEETVARRQRTKATVLGRAAVLKQNPLKCPRHIKKSPAPRCLHFGSAFRVAAAGFGAGEILRKAGTKH